MSFNPKSWKIGFRWTKGDASNPTGAIAVDNTSKALHIADIDDAGVDWNVAADSHPSVYVHSATTPATDYIKMYHDATDAHIDGVGATALKLKIAGTSEVDLTASAMSPSTSDGNALGTTALMWGDLFLASGGVVNFNNGDVTLTHSAGKLALGGDGAVELDLDGASMDVALPSGCVDKADLASEIYTIEHFFVTGNSNDFDNETIKLSRLWSAGTVVRVVYFTNAALGTSLGIDILDGGTDGSGTDVIDSCADDLNGVDVNTLTTPYAFSADDYLNVKFDDVTNDVSFTIDIQVKVPVVTAT